MLGPEKDGIPPFDRLLRSISGLDLREQVRRTSQLIIKMGMDAKFHANCQPSKNRPNLNITLLYSTNITLFLYATRSTIEDINSNKDIFRNLHINICDNQIMLHPPINTDPVYKLIQIITISCHLQLNLRKFIKTCGLNSCRSHS